MHPQQTQNNIAVPEHWQRARRWTRRGRVSVLRIMLRTGRRPQCFFYERPAGLELAAMKLQKVHSQPFGKCPNSEFSVSRRAELQLGRSRSV
jgi:hypothetical protein